MKRIKPEEQSKSRPPRVGPASTSGPVNPLEIRWVRDQVEESPTALDQIRKKFQIWKEKKAGRFVGAVYRKRAQAVVRRVGLWIQANADRIRGKRAS